MFKTILKTILVNLVLWLVVKPAYHLGGWLKSHDPNFRTVYSVGVTLSGIAWHIGFTGWLGRIYEEGMFILDPFENW